MARIANHLGISVSPWSQTLQKVGVTNIETISYAHGDLAMNNVEQAVTGAAVHRSAQTSALRGALSREAAAADALAAAAMAAATQGSRAILPALSARRAAGGRGRRASRQSQSMRYIK
jgi:hypothetical protein